MRTELKAVRCLWHCTGSSVNHPGSGSDHTLCSVQQGRLLSPREAENSNVPSCAAVLLVVSETPANVQPAPAIETPRVSTESQVNKSIYDHQLASCHLHSEASVIRPSYMYNLEQAWHFFRELAGSHLPAYHCPIPEDQDDGLRRRGLAAHPFLAERRGGVCPCPRKVPGKCLPGIQAARQMNP